MFDPGVEPYSEWTTMKRQRSEFERRGPAAASTGAAAGRIGDMIRGKIATHVVGTFAELGIADHLAGGPMSADELCRATGAHAPSLARLLRTLVGLDVLREVEPGLYDLTSAGELLRSDVPGSLRGSAIKWASEFHARAWASLTQSVVTGEPGFQRVYDMPLFDYLEKNPETAEMFDQAMTSSSAAHARAVVDAYDFSTVGTVVDVGGGHGTLLAEILKGNPSVRGVLFDMPHVVAGSGRVLDEAGVRGRVDVVGGNFFEEVPTGAGAYISMRIIHDWSDERAARILANCRAAMAPDGRVLVVDNLIDDGPGSLYGKLLDMEMLVMTPYGKERTEEEFRRLFAAAGLRLSRIVDTASPLKVLEGRLA